MRLTSWVTGSPSFPKVSCTAVGHPSSSRAVLELVSIWPWCVAWKTWRIRRWGLTLNKRSNELRTIGATRSFHRQRSNILYTIYYKQLVNNFFLILFLKIKLADRMWDVPGLWSLTPRFKCKMKPLLCAHLSLFCLFSSYILSFC